MTASYCIVNLKQEGQYLCYSSYFKSSLECCSNSCTQFVKYHILFNFQTSFDWLFFVFVSLLISFHVITENFARGFASVFLSTFSRERKTYLIYIMVYYRTLFLRLDCYTHCFTCAWKVKSIRTCRVLCNICIDHALWNSCACNRVNYFVNNSPLWQLKYISSHKNIISK